MIYSEKEIKKCCAEQIRKLWINHNGSMNILMGGQPCPICKQQISLTATTEEQANEFLQRFGLEPIKNPKPKPDLEKFEYAKKQLIYSLKVYISRFEEGVQYFDEIKKESDCIIDASILLKKMDETL